MKLQILNIEEFVKKNSLKQITSTNIYQKGNELDIDGLFSEEIFGRLGSQERRKKFGYIELKGKFIHPEAYKILCSVDTNLSKLINNKSKFIFQNGIVVESEEGDTGLLYFINNINKIKWEKFSKKPKNIKFIKNNIDDLIISKYLVLPAGIRDIQTSVSTGKTMIQYSEISNLYKTLIQQIKILPEDNTLLDEEFVKPMIQQTQNTLLEINNWFKKRMKGKQGLLRGSLTKKVIDYSGRFIITTDHTLELGYVGMPFQQVLKLYEPFALHYILKTDKSGLGLIQNFLKSDNPPDNNEIKRFFTKLTEDSFVIDQQLKQYLVTVAKEITRDRVILYKRDPVENRESWIASNIRVDEEGYSVYLNPMDLPRLGADHDGDQCAFIPLFTNESIKEAKEKMHPRYSKSMWTSVTNISSCPYTIELDAAAAIYASTKV